MPLGAVLEAQAQAEVSDDLDLGHVHELGHALMLRQRRDAFERHAVSSALPGIDPPDPYQVLVKIPNGFEYTGPDNSAETALAKRIVSRGAIELDISDGHSSMAYVRHGSSIQTGQRPVESGSRSG